MTLEAGGSVIIAVGDELLAGHTLDTNSNWLALRLRALGHPLRRVHVVPDADAEIIRWVQFEIAAAPAFIFLCGGLGPTPDDRTLAGLGHALGRPLRLEPIAAAHIQARLDWLRNSGYIASNEMSEANRRMAEVPEGAVVLRNPVGMAPGLAVETGGGHLFVLPGVPRELKAIFDDEIAPRYLGGGVAYHTAEVHFERAVEAEFWDVLTRVGREYPDLSVGSYPQPDRGHLIIRLTGIDAARVEEGATAVRLGAPAKLRKGE